MTKNTDYCDVLKLMDQFTSKTPYVISQDEMALVSDILELGTRNSIELQNIRNVVTMMYSQKIDQAGKDGDWALAQTLMDIESGVTSTIDLAEFQRRNHG